MKKWKVLIPALALSAMLAGCGSPASNEVVPSGEQAPVSEQVATGEQETSTYKVTVSPTVSSSTSDETGTTVFEDVTFEQMPERIVVLDYGFLDTLDALGVEGVVGLPKGSTGMPENLAEKYGDEKYVDIGTLKSIDMEQVAALEPDAIFISGRQTAFYEELKKITPNVLFIGNQVADYWNSFMTSIDIAGEIFDKQDEAEQLKADLEAKKAEVNEKAAGYDNALVAMYNDKKISGFDAGSDSRFGYVYNYYGFNSAVGEDISVSNHGSDFSYESILSVDPEVLFIVDRTNSDVEVIKADIENDIIKQTQAYKNGKIVYLDGANWYFGSNGYSIEMAKMQEILDELK